MINLLGDLISPDSLIILKARQLGISWLVCMFCLWKAKFFENAKILFLSQGQDEAYDLIKKCKFIDDNLPDYLKTKRDPNQDGKIGFPDTGSDVVALPSTEKAGRSTDASIVVCDEWEFHPYAENNFAAIKPTIGAGGKFIGLSTADKTKLNTFFKQKYLEAKSGQNNFKAIFLPWNLRPGRTEEWFKNEIKDYRPWQVEQEYPSTESEALSTLKSIPFFSIVAIDSMKADVMSPIPHELSDKHKQLIHVYKLPVVGKRYLLFTDPSDGYDPHASIVIDSQTGEEVASSHGRTGADHCAMIHDELARTYNNAFNNYELNSRAGGIFSQKLKDLDTPNQAYFVNADGKLNLNKKGWFTGDKLKDNMLWGLEEAIRLRQIVPHRKDCLEEFEQFMKPEGEDPQTPKGGHDDYIMAWAGVWQLRKYLPAEMGEVRSYHYHRK